MRKIKATSIDLVTKDSGKKRPQKKALESKNGYTLGDIFTVGTYNGSKGRLNPSRTSFKDLRNLSRANNIVRNCINRVIHSVTKTDWFVKPIDPKTDPQVYGQYIDYVTNLLKYPNEVDTTKDLMTKIVEDILVIDRGVIEKVRNPKGYIVSLYQTDGECMRPNIDEYGLYKSPAFYQYLNNSSNLGTPDAEFEAEDLIIFQMNPSGENGRIGYGMSPVEAVIQTVVTTLQAAIYNASYFNSKKLPPFLANIPRVTKEDLIAFKNQFMQAMEQHDWDVAFTNSPDPIDMKQLRPSNQDMQFYQLNEWLSKVVISSFELSPQNFGLTADINRATSETQERLEQGVHNVIDEIQDKINREIIGDLAQLDPNFRAVEFKFDTVNKLDELQKAQINDIYLKDGVLVPNEVRQEDLGLDPVEGGDKIITTQGLGGFDYQSMLGKSTKWTGWY